MNFGSTGPWNTSPTVEAAADRIEGFEQILDGEALEQLGLVESIDRILGFRDGFAWFAAMRSSTGSSRGRGSSNIAMQRTRRAGR